MSGKVSSSSLLQKLIEDLSGLVLLASPGVSNCQTATGKMCFFLGLRIERNRFCKVSLLAIGCGECRIQVKIMGIELLRPLSLDDGFFEPVIRQVGGGSDIANYR